MSTISNINAQTILEFANLQVASEAFLAKLESTPGKRTGEIDLQKAENTDLLTEGNKHSTKFPPSMVDDFVEKWKVVDHISNTKTGFSGTLFVAKKQIINSDGTVIANAGEQVISFRSTEFVEDAVRDNKMTNNLV